MKFASSPGTLVAILLVLTSSSFANAQNVTAEVCSANSGGCLECVTAGCAWAIGGCQPSCEGFPLACYSRALTPTLTSQSVCELQQSEARDAATCGIQTTCESCTTTALSASSVSARQFDGGPTTCSWYEGRGSCSNLERDANGVSSPYCPSSSQGECYFGATNCDDCLQLLTSSGIECSWSGGNCELFCAADTTCYNTNLFPSQSSDEICVTANQDEADADLCLGQLGCTSCTSTIQSDGVTNCQWYFDNFTSTGWCSVGGGGCVNGNCGLDSCEGIPQTTFNSVCGALGALDPNDITCQACLDANCGWTTVGFGGGQCLGSCSILADAPCFEPSLSGQTNVNICLEASAEAADSSICRAEDDCADCVTTLKSDRRSTCEWYQSTTTGANSYCGTGTSCDQLGTCPSTTCSAATTGSAGACNALNDCASCLDSEPCVWIEDSCQLSCDALPAATCYSETNPDFSGQSAFFICSQANSASREIATPAPTSRGTANYNMMASSSMLASLVVGLWTLL